MTGLSDSEFRSSSFYMFSLILFKVEFLLVKYDSNTWSNFGSVKWAKKDGSMNFELVIWNENTRLFVLVRVRVLLLLRRNTSSPESVFDIWKQKHVPVQFFRKFRVRVRLCSGNYERTNVFAPNVYDFVHPCPRSQKKILQ